MRTWLPRTPVGVAAVIALATCGTDDDPAPSSERDRPEVVSEQERPTSAAPSQVQASPSEIVPSALDDMRDPAFPDPVVDPT
jgi:hypothetical protein